MFVQIASGCSCKTTCGFGCHCNRWSLQAIGQTLDGIIDTVSAKHPLALYLNTLKVGGVSVMLGVPDEPMDLPTFNIIMRECFCCVYRAVCITLYASTCGMHWLLLLVNVLSFVHSCDTMSVCYTAHCADEMKCIAFAPVPASVKKELPLSMHHSMSSGHTGQGFESCHLQPTEQHSAVHMQKGMLSDFLCVVGRLRIGGSPIGGIKETQDMLNFCSKHNITCEVEDINIDYVNTAMERLLKNDVHYRFVIDVQGSLIQ